MLTGSLDYTASIRPRVGLSNAVAWTAGEAKPWDPAARRPPLPLSPLVYTYRKYYNRERKESIIIPPPICKIAHSVIFRAGSILSALAKRTAQAQARGADSRKELR